MAGPLIAPADLIAAGVAVRPQSPPPGYEPPAGSLPWAEALALCLRATAAAERHCRRPLARADHDEVLRPSATSVLRLGAWPVVALASLRGDPATALTIRASGSPWAATATLGAATLTLAADGSPPATLPLGGYPTIGHLAAAVDATPGWSAEVADGWGGGPVAELLPRAVSLGALGAGARFEGYRTDASGRLSLHAPTGRLRTPGEQLDDSSWGPHATRYRVPASPGPIRARYTAGFNADPLAGDVDVPPDLARAVVLIALADGELSKASGSIKSVTLGNSAVTYRDAGELLAVPAAAAPLLSPYVDRRF